MGTPITIPPTVTQSRSLPELQQALAVWTRQVQQAVRQVGAQADTAAAASGQIADASHTGLLSAADWSVFNDKQGAGDYLTDAPSDGTTYGRNDGAWTAVGTPSSGNLTEATSDVLTITGGTGAVLGTGTSVQVKEASASQDGYLSSADWTTFNDKQAAGAYLTDAPTDGQQYCRQSAAWAVISASSGSGGTDYSSWLKAGIERGTSSAVGLATSYTATGVLNSQYAALTRTNTLPVFSEKANAGSTAGFITAADFALQFQSKFTVGSILIDEAYSCRYFFCLTDSSLSTMLASDTPSANYIGFRCDNSVSSNWFAVSCNGSSTTAVDTGVALATGQSFDVTWPQDFSSVTFSINGTSVGTISTNLPAATTLVGILLGIQSLDSNSPHIGAAFAYLYQKPYV